MANRRKMAVAVGQGPLRHGASGYANHGCRCVNCRVATYLKDPTAVSILRAHGIVRDGADFIMTQRVPSPFIRSRQAAVLMLGRLLPDDFDDDSRVFAAVLRYHAPQAWADAL